jgi:hypothetical protein
MVVNIKLNEDLVPVMYIYATCYQTCALVLGIVSQISFRGLILSNIIKTSSTSTVFIILYSGNA